MKITIEINSIHGETEDVSEALCLLATEFETQGIAAVIEQGQSHYLGGVYMTVFNAEKE